MAPKTNTSFFAFLRVPLTRDKTKLRKFGLVMFGALIIIQSFLWWKDAYTLWISVVASLFLVLALIAPKLLSPIEWAWMRIAHVMGFVMTRVILTITFLIAVFPTGVIMRLAGKDLLNRRMDTDVDSYWIPTENDGPWTRPEKPY